MDHKKMIL